VRIISICALLAAGFMNIGCGDLLSLHPLYTGQDQVANPALEGKWENKDSIIVIAREPACYLVTLESKKGNSETSKFEMHLVNIGGVQFADVLAFDYIGHMFVKVSLAGGQLRFAFLDSKWLRDRIPHDEADLPINRKQAVLTVRTPRLQALVAKYATEPKAYDEEQTFRRIGL